MNGIAREEGGAEVRAGESKGHQEMAWEVRARSKRVAQSVAVKR